MVTTTVDSAAALNLALQHAQGGDIIQLAAGTYSGLAIRDLAIAGGVTITSADPLHQAVLTDFGVSNSQGLAFRNLEFAAIDRTDTNSSAYKVYSSSNITFDHVQVHGSLDGNAQNDVAGLSILKSSGVTVTNSEFTQLNHALAFGMTDHVTVAGNFVHDVRTDGFDFAQVSYVEVRGNTFRNFNPVLGDHPDAIQFWTSGTTVASHDIVVADNAILRGEGGGTQGIFFRDQEGGLSYERVTIANNLVSGTGYNGIRVVGAKDLTVSGNQLISIPGDANKTFMLINHADHVTSTGNTAIQISYDGVTNLLQSGNTLNTVVSDGGAAALKAWQSSHAAAAAPQALMVGSAETMGDAGDNALNGTSAADNIYGDAGADTITDAGGDNTLRGGDGDDRITGGSGVEHINGNLGNDTAAGGLGNDWVAGGKDNDRLAGDAGADIVVGNMGSDNCAGGDGDDIVRGGQGADLVSGGAGADWLSGDRGDDTVTGGAGADVFYTFGDAGIDRVTDFSRADGDRIQLEAGTHYSLAQVGADTIISMAGGGQMILVGVSMTSLSGGWLFGA